MPFKDYIKQKERSRINSAAWRALPGNKEKVAAARKRKWHNAMGWPIHACYEIKYRAKKAGIPFNMRPRDIPVPDTCPVFGTQFVFGAHLHPRSPTVDRIRPTLGYVVGNVRVISHRANAMKNNSISSTEALQLALYMEREGL